MKKNCVICGGEFSARGIKKTCGPDCAAKNEQSSQRRRRPPTRKICVICGAEFVLGGSRKNRRKTCIGKCSDELTAAIHRRARSKWELHNPIKISYHRDQLKAQKKAWRLLLDDRYVASSLRFPVRLVTPGMIALQRARITIVRFMKATKLWPNQKT